MQLAHRLWAEIPCWAKGPRQVPPVTRESLPPRVRTAGTNQTAPATLPCTTFSALPCSATPPGRHSKRMEMPRNQGIGRGGVWTLGLRIYVVRPRSMTTCLSEPRAKTCTANDVGKRRRTVEKPGEQCHGLRSCLARASFAQFVISAAHAWLSYHRACTRDWSLPGVARLRARRHHHTKNATARPRSLPRLPPRSSRPGSPLIPRGGLPHLMRLILGLFTEPSATLTPARLFHPLRLTRLCADRFKPDTGTQQPGHLTVGVVTVVRISGRNGKAVYGPRRVEWPLMER
jgi:hypothetical protein